MVDQTDHRDERGLLFVLSDPPPGGDEDFHAWYERHVAARIALPGFEVARRAISLTGRPEFDSSPLYMADYDLTSLAALETPEYTEIMRNPPEGEPEMIASLPARPDRRVYRQLAEYINDGYDPESVGGAIALGMTVDDPDDLAAWYEQEHIPLLFRVPGWMRIRRYELVDGAGPQYLALHDLADPTTVDHPAAAPARDTPWRTRIAESRTALEYRVYSIMRRYLP